MQSYQISNHVTNAGLYKNWIKMYKYSIQKKSRPTQEMRSIISQTSLNSLQQPAYESTPAIFRQLSKKLEQASTILPFHEFNSLLKKTIHKCIKKAEVDSTFVDAVPNIKKWISIYSHDLQILARVLILQAILLSKELPNQALQKFNKVKHMLVETEVQFLIVKVFVGESRVYEIMGDRDMKLKILKKCIQYGQNYTVEYLKQTTQIRLQLADNMIIAYFQIFKLLKQTKPNSSIEYLSKSYQAALKNYGHDHFSTQSLSTLLHQHRNILSNIERITPKALSQIQVISFRKNYVLCILYSWEEELIVVQLEKIGRGDQRRVVGETVLNTKLDVEKMRILKAKPWGDWIEVNGHDIRIYQDMLRKILESESQQKVQVPAVNSSTLRAYEKGDLFKRNGQEAVESSSSDDQDIILPQQQKFIRYYRDKSHMSRSKSRDQHTSRH